MAGLYGLIIIGVIICPISIVMMIAALAMNRSIFRKSHWGTLIVGIIGIVLAYIGYRLQAVSIPFMKIREILGTALPFLNLKYTHIGIRDWIKGDLFTFGVMTVVEMISLYFATMTPERMMMEEERRRERAKMVVQKIDYLIKRSQVIFGVSGAGKSAYLGKQIDEILKADKNAFIIVVDGKGSTEKYSLYYSCKIIARKYKKKLDILNGTTNTALGGAVYDFLDGVSAVDAMKDMVMSLVEDLTVKESSGSEHYKVLTENYLLIFVEFMRRHEIDVTIANLIKILDPKDLDAVMEQMKITAEEREEMHSFAETNWPDVQANIMKIKMFLHGQGKKIFTGKGKRTNLRKAYEQRDIVLVLADEMSMPKLAAKLVQLVTFDLRNLVAGRLTGKIDMNSKIYAFYDEFSSYTASVPVIKSLYARARSADTIMTLATQSCSDIIGLGGGWFETLIDTADRFVIFRQNSAEAAEAAASIFGTEIHVTGTARSSQLVATGEASNTADRAFVISPDMIRNLPTNHGFLLDKTQKPGQQLKYFRNLFVKEVKRDDEQRRDRKSPRRDKERGKDKQSGSDKKKSQGVRECRV